MMKNTLRFFIAVTLTPLAFQASAQYTQLGPKNEFMFKVEAGFGPFMGNAGKPGDNGYNLSHYESVAGLNVMAGANISQDWFLGGGVGGNYYFSLKQLNATPMFGANVFVDVDFRPIWKAVMGVDYQPTSINWAPLMGIRAGGSMLFADKMLFTPLAEAYGGINWYYGQYYARGMRNKTRIWHSLYATLGVAYMQQTVFLPIRVGWRW